MKLFTTHSPNETLALGERIGHIAQAGDVLALFGDLGAGKTVLVKGIARGLGCDPDAVTSATFVLMVEHRGRLTLYHLDAYRLTGPAAILEIGAEEAFYGEGVCVVEWADRVSGALPPERLDVRMEIVGENDRTLCFFPRGKRADDLLPALMKG